MARTDLVGLLTGIGPSPIDPTTAMTPRQAALQRGAQYGQGFRRGVGALTGADTRTTGDLTQEAIQGLDFTKPEDLRKLASIQRATGDFVGAAKTAGALQQLSQEKSTRDSLIRLAKSQKNSRAEEWLNSGGDVSTIASVLLKDPSLAKAEAFTTMYEGDKAIRVGIINGTLHKATDKGWEVIPDDVKLSGTAPVKVPERKPTSVAVTKEDKKVYNSVLEENKDIEDTISSRWGGTDVDQKTILIDKAHQIWKNADPQITREAALRKAAELEEPSDPFSNA